MHAGSGIYLCHSQLCFQASSHFDDITQLPNCQSLLRNSKDIFLKHPRATQYLPLLISFSYSILGSTIEESYGGLRDTRNHETIWSLGNWWLKWKLPFAERQKVDKIEHFPERLFTKLTSHISASPVGSWGQQGTAISLEPVQLNPQGTPKKAAKR